MKKIDAHAHIGEIGGWANVAATPQQLLELMDMYEIEKTVICSQNNEAVYRQSANGRIVLLVLCMLTRSRKTAHSC